VTTSARGEAALKRRKGGDDVSRVDTNLTGPKIKKIHAVSTVVQMDGKDLN
jgi:hypothetical protein